MAKKPATRPAAGATELQRPAAEVLYADELNRLAAAAAARSKPKGWRLTPRSVLAFVLGSDELGTQPKFVDGRAFLERAVVALATNRGLVLIVEPGTAKSYLSESLAVAISGDSTLTISGEPAPPKTTSSTGGITRSCWPTGRATARWCRPRCTAG